MMRYEVVRAAQMEVVASIVNDLLKQGWETTGGISCDSSGNYMQAVVFKNKYTPFIATARNVANLSDPILTPRRFDETY